MAAVKTDSAELAAGKITVEQILAATSFAHREEIGAEVEYTFYHTQLNGHRRTSMTVPRAAADDWDVKILLSGVPMHELIRI